jgi:hypothetical protein
MTSCGFDTMEQCQAASSGIGGDCFADPKSQSNSASNANANALGGINRKAFAYQPRASRPVHRGRYGHAATSN